MPSSCAPSLRLGRCRVQASSNRGYSGLCRARIQRIGLNYGYLMRWAGKKYRRLRPYKWLKAWWSGLPYRAPNFSPGASCYGLSWEEGRPLWVMYW